MMEKVAMSRSEVESSNIESIGYDNVVSILEIAFLSGGIYQYHGVPEHVYRQLIEAESKGRFFHRNIRSEYSWARIV